MAINKNKTTSFLVGRMDLDIRRNGFEVLLHGEILHPRFAINSHFDIMLKGNYGMRLVTLKRIIMFPSSSVVRKALVQTSQKEANDKFAALLQLCGFIKNNTNFTSTRYNWKRGSSGNANNIEWNVGWSPLDQGKPIIVLRALRAAHTGLFREFEITPALSGMLKPNRKALAKPATAQMYYEDLGLMLRWLKTESIPASPLALNYKKLLDDLASAENLGKKLDPWIRGIEKEYQNTVERL